MESGDYMKRSDLRIYLTYSHIYLRKVKTDCFSQATILITINLLFLLAKYHTQNFDDDTSNRSGKKFDSY